MDSNSVLNVENLSVSIDQEKILDHVSFSVTRGEALAIIGPNGAGKTMLFRALLGLIPHEGTITWSVNTKIAYVPQKFFVDRTIPITVLEFFLLQRKHFWFPSKETLEHLHHELALVGLPENILHKPVAGLSGGQLQRILIAWAMMTHPDVLLFDEPTTGIDVGGEETIYNIIHKLQDERGTTILLISHDLNIIYRYAQSVLCLNKEVQCHGVPVEVLKPEELTKLYGEGRFYHHLEKP